jgi:hypothetical protein
MSGHKFLDNKQANIWQLHVQQLTSLKYQKAKLNKSFTDMM